MQKLTQGIPIGNGSFSDTLRGTEEGWTVKNPVLGNLNSLTGSDFLSQFIPKAIGLLFVFGGLAFFFMFLWGAISWILSGGDKAHVESAKGRITSSVIGFILMISVFAISIVLEKFFKIDILSIDIGPLVIQ